MDNIRREGVFDLCIKRVININTTTIRNKIRNNIKMFFSSRIMKWLSNVFLRHNSKFGKIINFNIIIKNTMFIKKSNKLSFLNRDMLLM